MELENLVTPTMPRKQAKMNIVVSMENATGEKTNIGKFSSSFYSSMFVDALLRTNLSKKEYVKIIVEIEEET